MKPPFERLTVCKKPTMMSYLLPMNKHFEGFFSNWYKCTSSVDTIGYGHTGSMAGLKPAPWTEEYASEVLQQELEGNYLSQTIEACCKIGIDFHKLTEPKQAALVSACYNAGPNIIRKGTWAILFRCGKKRELVEKAFYLWNKSGGKTSPGLVRRRFAEMVLFWDGKVNTDPDGWREYYEAHK